MNINIFWEPNKIVFKTAKNTKSWHWMLSWLDCYKFQSVFLLDYIFCVFFVLYNCFYNPKSNEKVWMWDPYWNQGIIPHHDKFQTIPGLRKTILVNLVLKVSTLLIKVTSISQSRVKRKYFSVKVCPMSPHPSVTGEANWLLVVFKHREHYLNNLKYDRYADGPKIWNIIQKGEKSE